MITTYIKNKVVARVSFLLLTTSLLTPFMTSCQDMLETESPLQVFDPELDQKTDSMFYTLGILKGVQQAIDQYVLFNEMRGELTTINQYSSTDLRELANFSTTTENKYDSAYVFYRIINNCNYFIQHRDTTLLTGARKVAMPEYVQAYSIRAWAYLQLAKMYGEVQFFTEPITNISEANAVREKKDIRGICEALAPQLKYYADSTALAAVPDYNGDTPVDVGSSSATGDKTVHLRKIFFPVGLVLGDLYLETEQYENAAKCYFKYLNDNKLAAGNYSAVRELTDEEHLNWPEFSFRAGRDWDIFFTSQDPKDIKDVITYVPMAVNKLQGQITDLPRLFGYDMYSMGVTSRYLLKREIDASQTYRDLSKNQDYYYTPKTSTNTTIDTAGIGDTRLHETLRFVSKDDSTFYEMRKYERGNVFIYRTSTVYLRLAEALNRMGYPDAAFAILKDGFNEDLEADSIYLKTNSTYLSKDSRDMLRTTIPFFSTENKVTYAKSKGVHSYGTGETGGRRSPYQFTTMAYQKYLELQEQFGKELFPDILVEVSLPVLDEEGEQVYDEEGNPVTETVTVLTWSKEALMNVVEDLSCDEYALELAFEGHRFGDLCRLARHKNEAGIYGSNFGGQWLAKKLEKKSAVVDLTNPANWYLPMGK